jgi:hypothetical protein
VASQNLKYATKKPRPWLMVKASKGEYQRSVKVIARGPMFLPTLPFLSVLGKDIERLMFLIPFSKNGLCNPLNS